MALITLTNLYNLIHLTLFQQNYDDSHCYKTSSSCRCQLYPLSQTYILTYLCLFARWEHRPSTKERRRFLSVAIFSISLLVYPISFVSFSVSLPGVSWPTSSSLPWGVPCDGLTGDGVWWFPECMSYPPPFSLLYFIFYG